MLLFHLDYYQCIWRKKKQTKPKRNQSQNQQWLETTIKFREVIGQIEDNKDRIILFYLGISSVIFWLLQLGILATIPSFEKN